jgi:hypothetical protein
MKMEREKRNMKGWVKEHRLVVSVREKSGRRERRALARAVKAVLIGR